MFVQSQPLFQEPYCCMCCGSDSQKPSEGPDVYVGGWMNAGQAKPEVSFAF